MSAPNSEQRERDVVVDRNEAAVKVASENREVLECIANGDDKWASLACRLLEEADGDG